jgi:hypothetical protein
MDNEHNVVNLARADPGYFVLSNPTSKSHTQYIKFNNRLDVALCVMVATCYQDEIQEPHHFNTTSGPQVQKSITVVPLTLEMDRQIGTISMIVDEHMFYGPVYLNQLKITTLFNNLCEYFSYCNIFATI